MRDKRNSGRALLGQRGKWNQQQARRQQTAQPATTYVSVGNAIAFQPLIGVVHVFGPPRVCSEIGGWQACTES